MHQFKKTHQTNPKKYESLINKKKDLKKTKHIRTEGESQKDDYTTSFYPSSKLTGSTKYHNPQLADPSPSQINPRLFGSVDKIEKKKSVSLH